MIFERTVLEVFECGPLFLVFGGRVGKKHFIKICIVKVDPQNCIKCLISWIVGEHLEEPSLILKIMSYWKFLTLKISLSD